MAGAIARYTRWLHTGWPAGEVEPLPEVAPDGSTGVSGLYVVGDLTGVPLLKLAADSGARAVRTIVEDPSFRSRPIPGSPGVRDLIIVGGGVSGMAAALEARKRGLDALVIEAAEPFSTVVNFPKAKPIFAYPTEMVPAGQLSVTASVKEPLLAELRRQAEDAGISPLAARVARVARVRGSARVLAVELENGASLLTHRVIIAIGRSGDHRKLEVPGETLDKVSNRLHDPHDFSGSDVLVVGGGDSALETAAAVAAAGGRVTLSYRQETFARPKPENVEAVSRQTGLRVVLGSVVKAIRPNNVVLGLPGGHEETVRNDAVFTMIGREPPLPFLRRSGVKIRGEWTPATWAGLLGFLAFCVFVYLWKAGAFPFGVPWALPANVFGVIAVSAGSPGFYYSLAYCLCVLVFGIRRIRRRKTPYVTLQTVTLTVIQIIPLFLLPYVLLPWMGHHGWFDQGTGRWLADQLFPVTSADPHGREYWRAFGLILAWPLFIWNVFSAKPMALWLAISVVQTFVILPAIIYRWGKGAYCGWICSCGALAETMGDAHREKMPHGKLWNRLNMIGQVLLVVVGVLALLRTVSWIWPGSIALPAHDGLLRGYYWIVDVGFAGILGVGLYFHFSGRVWCRFACPLAALMHVYARFSSFRILADKKKCISCNVCTSVCHQGIDIMSFANKGLPMEDPQCVRCSACVQSCPTGVLTFGRVDRKGALLTVDSLLASPVQRVEAR